MVISLCKVSVCSFKGSTQGEIGLIVGMLQCIVLFWCLAELYVSRPTCDFKTSMHVLNTSIVQFPFA